MTYSKEPKIFWPEKPGTRFSIIYLVDERNKPINPKKPVVVFGQQGENKYQLRKRIFSEVTDGRPYRAPIERDYSIEGKKIKIRPTRHLPKEYTEDGWKISV